MTRKFLGGFSVPPARRVEKKIAGVARDYVYNLSGQVVAETGSAGLAVGYIYLGGSLVAEYENGTTYFIHRDHLGSTRLMTTLAQGIAECDDYMPFGELMLCPSGGTSATTHKFTGKERDGESNLDNFGARYNSSQMGRFMIPDWAERPTDVPYAEFGDPQSLNLYSYLTNNPLNRADETGHCDPGDTACAAGEMATPIMLPSPLFMSPREQQIYGGIAALAGAATGFGAVGELASSAPTTMNAAKTVISILGTSSALVGGTTQLAGAAANKNVDDAD